MLSSIREVYPRFDVIRNGVAFDCLEAVDTPSVRMSSDAAIKLVLSGTFRHNPRINYLTDRIRAYLVIDGREFPCGEFVTASVRLSQDGEGPPLAELSCYDLTYLVQRKRTESRLHFSAGQRYDGVIQGLLLEAGLSRFLLQPTSQTLQTDREDWDAGTSYLDMINALLSEINYDSLAMDLSGNLLLQAKRKGLAEEITHTYRAGETSLLSPEAASSNDVFGKANVFTVTVSNPDLPEPMTATAVNDSPSSLFSTVYLGRIAAPVEQLDNISSQDQLQAKAEDLKFQSLLSSEDITFSTALNPVHGVRDVIALHHPAARGIYLETQWELPMKAGELMAHTARKAVILG